MSNSEQNEWVRVGEVAEFAPGTATAVELEGRSIAIFRLESDGSLHATNNICTHKMAYLTDGWVDGDTIECPLHGGCFDIRTGRGLCEPITEDLGTHEVRVDGEAVYVRLSR